MKTNTSALLIALVALTGSNIALAAGPGTSVAAIGSRPGVCCTTPVVQALGKAESEMLLWMREEEKLAHDVYLSLNSRWQDRVFNSIAVSEQRHFEALGTKIALFGLTDPALPTLGVFADQELQALYNKLWAQGQASLVAALSVGASIEELDILDLQEALKSTLLPYSLQTTYGSLLDGSKNHLRTFVARLQALGIDYEPQHIDPVLFDAIVGN